jgi:hypothetical protein
LRCFHRRRGDRRLFRSASKTPAKCNGKQSVCKDS